MGANPAYRGIRRKVTGHAKAEARDKLRELHREAATGDRASDHTALTDALAEAAPRRPGSAAVELPERDLFQQ